MGWIISEKTELPPKIQQGQEALNNMEIRDRKTPLTLSTPIILAVTHTPKPVLAPTIPVAMAKA